MSAVGARRSGHKHARTDIEHDYERLKPEILRTVKRKLSARGVHVDDADLDALYNQAWHGVYTRLAAGEPIANRAGLVVTIAERRGLDEARSLRLDRRAAVDELDRQPVEPDLAERLDDKARLSRFVEGLRGGLTLREQRAAALCYLHDYTRREAAAMLGVSPRRMEKLMDAVSKKVAALLEDLQAGEWCEPRDSLMKAYALGLLDRNGARYVLAVAHLDDCPACRYRVLRMRGLAALTPPAPGALALLAAGEHGSSGASGSHGEKTGPGRRVRQVTATVAAAGALTVTALAGVRLADHAVPPGRAVGAGAVTGGTPPVGGGAGPAPTSTTTAAPTSTSTAAPTSTSTAAATSSSTAAAPTATPRVARTRASAPKRPRSRPKRPSKRPPPAKRGVTTAPAVVATETPAVTATTAPPAVPAVPAVPQPPRDQDGAGEFELR